MEANCIICKCGKLFKSMKGLKSHLTQSYYCPNKKTVRCLSCNDDFLPSENFNTICVVCYCKNNNLAIKK